MILHIALLRFRSGLTPDEIRSFGQFVEQSCRSIPSIERALVGPRADIDAGYDRRFGESTYDAVAILQFADETKLRAYLQDPRHRELGRRFWEISESVLVFETAAVDLTSERAPAEWFKNFAPRS